MSERVSIDNLKPGMVIVQVSQQNGPVKIKKSGLVSSIDMIDGLREMGVLEVEIDPSLTVEIEEHSQPSTTTTQALLRGQHDKSSGVNEALSEQFNRSLFLPTVQSLPSAWKIYSKQALSYVLIVVGGLSIGFTVATHSLWWPNSVSTEQTRVVPANEKPVAEERTQVDELAERDIVNDDTPALITNKEPGQSKENTLPQQATKTVSDTELLTNEPERSERLSSAEDKLGGKIVNQGDEPPVQVSPELLAKFNQAVDALDNQVEDEKDEIPVTVHSSVPRVDQLPARLLTRLPNMNFSAHMYASQARDRWVRVNGVQLSEGEWIDDRVQIVSIEAQQVILGFEGELFTMAALTDW